jgi:hypothetical protein
METPDNRYLPAPPSGRRLAITTAGALVLPAEYGLDPLGTGHVLGLTKLFNADAPPDEPASVIIGDALKPTQAGPISRYAGEFKIDSRELTIGPYDYLEYKYRLEEGASMQYSWTSSLNLNHDFHGEQESGASKREQSFDKQTRRQDFGTLRAPFSGIHGWYWENPGAEPVTIKVTTAGFYTSAIEIRSDRSRKTHEVTPLANITMAPAAP